MSAQGYCEFLVKRARELVEEDPWAAKAWLITARSLYPADFNIQVGHAAAAAPPPLPDRPLPLRRCRPQCLALAWPRPRPPPAGLVAPPPPPGRRPGAGQKNGGAREQR